MILFYLVVKFVCTILDKPSRELYKAIYVWSLYKEIIKIISCLQLNLFIENSDKRFQEKVCVTVYQLQIFQIMQPFNTQSDHVSFKALLSVTRREEDRCYWDHVLSWGFHA